MDFSIEIQPLNPNWGIGNVFQQGSPQLWRAVIGQRCYECESSYRSFVGMCAFFIPAGRGGGGGDGWCLTCSRCHLSCRRYGSLCTCPWRGWGWTSQCWGRSRTGSCKTHIIQIFYYNIHLHKNLQKYIEMKTSTEFPECCLSDLCTLCSGVHVMQLIWELKWF